MQIPGFMGPNGFVWFFGIVEDISNDSLQIGRLKVRCYGYHTDNQEELPTDLLPWAIHMKPVTNGSDFSPTGIELGTVVFGFFLDGPAAQYPIIIGAVDNVLPREQSDPAAPPQEILRGRGGGQSVIPGQQLPQGEQPVTPPGVVTQLGNLTEPQYNAWKAVMGQREYRAVNQIGFVGKYQFGWAALTDINFVRNIRSNAALRQDSAWNGPKSQEFGIRSLNDFLGNNRAQEVAMDLYTRLHFVRLTRMGVLSNSSTAPDTGGFLSVAHLLGADGARNFSRGDRTGRDANGTTGREYFDLGSRAVRGAN